MNYNLKLPTDKHGVLRQMLDKFSYQAQLINFEWPVKFLGLL